MSLSRTTRLTLAAALFMGLAAPAYAADPTPAQIAAARTVVTGSGVSRSFEAVIPNVMNQMATSLLRTRPELTADVQASLQTLKPQFDGYTTEMVDNAARILASSMSEDDLKQTAAFFNSTAGKSYVSTQPMVLGRLMNSMTLWTQSISEKMVEALRGEMKKRGKEI